MPRKSGKTSTSTSPPKYVDQNFAKYNFVVTYSREHTGHFLCKLAVAGARKLRSLLRDDKENMPRVEVIMMDWLPAKADKSCSVSLHLPEPAFSLSGDCKAEIYYDGPEKDVVTVTSRWSSTSPSSPGRLEPGSPKQSQRLNLSSYT